MMPWGLRWLDYSVSKWGRKYTLAIFAGASSFLIVIAGMWASARVGVETARILEQLVSAYLLSAAGMVGAYSASNAVVERAHAHHAVPPRASGSIQTPDGQ
jgi:hypothetical protein